MNHEARLELAINAALEAGRYLRERQGIAVESGEGRDIKLSSDKLSEQIIIDALLPSRIPILSEERGLIGKNEGLCWIIDPLDGSMNYYKGLDDLACVSIALCDSGNPVLGVVNRFMRDELFSGMDGGQAALNGISIRPSGVTESAQAVLVTGFPLKRDYTHEALARFVRYVQCFKKIRMLGAAALMAAFVACSRVDAYIEEDIMLWDVAAAVAIVRAAGGVADLQRRTDYRCVCRCFSTRELMEDFDAKGI